MLGRNERMTTAKTSENLRRSLPALLGISGEKIHAGRTELVETTERHFSVERKFLYKASGVASVPYYVNTPRLQDMRGTVVMLPRMESPHGKYYVTHEVRNHIGHYLAEQGWATVTPVLLGQEERAFPQNPKKPWYAPWERGIRDLLHEGKTWPGQAVLDVFRILRACRNQEAVGKKPVGIIGMQGSNLVSVCAALLDPTLCFVACLRTLGDYKDREKHCFFDSYGEYVPRLLQYADLSDLISALAKRPLFLSHNDDIISRKLVTPLLRRVAKAYDSVDAKNCFRTHCSPGTTFCDAKTLSVLLEWINSRSTSVRKRMNEKSLSFGAKRHIVPVRTRVTDRKQWIRQRKRALAIFKDLAGGFPCPSTPVRARKIETKQNEFCLRETLRLRLASGEYAQAYFYSPTLVAPSGPAILAIHNHGGRYWAGRMKRSDEEWVAALVRAGFPVLIMDQLGFGDRRGNNPINHGACPDWFEISGMYTSMRGQTLPGIMIRDLMSAIDYLACRKEVDPDRIGATGYSMGGSLTVFLSAIEERVKAAVSVNGHYLERLESKRLQSTLSAHKMIPGLLQYFDGGVLAALIAPRPLLYVNSLQNTTKPKYGPRQIADVCKRIYRLYDANDRFRFMTPEGHHAYLPSIQEEAITWFQRWL